MGMQPKDYDEILVALRRITRAIDLQSKRLLKTTGLTTSQLLVLQVIDDLGSPTPSSISREVVLSQATVTSLIDRLERNGMVSRFKSASDRRAVNIRLTPLAEEKLKDAPELLQAGFLKKYRKNAIALLPSIPERWAIDADSGIAFRSDCMRSTSN